MYTQILIQNIPIPKYFQNNEKIFLEAKWKWRKDFSLNKYRNTIGAQYFNIISKKDFFELYLNKMKFNKINLLIPHFFFILCVLFCNKFELFINKPEFFFFEATKTDDTVLDY